MRNRLSNSYVLQSGLEVTAAEDNITLDLNTPLLITVMYNLSGNRGTADRSFSVSPAGSLVIDYASNQEYRSHPHHHDFFELLIVLDGKIVQNIEGVDYQYSAGSCCLINRNISHFETFPGAGTVLFLQISPALLSDLIVGVRSDFFPGRLPFQNRLLAFMEENMSMTHAKSYLDIIPHYTTHAESIGTNEEYVYGEENSLRLHMLSEQLIHHLFLPSLGSEFIIRGLLYTLFNYLDQENVFHIHQIALKTRNEDLLFSRIRLLLEDSHGRIKRSELERSLHYSGNYLNTIVKRHTGLSLFDYGTQITMREAAHMLSDTDMSVADVMAKLRFTNNGHFNRLFEAHNGMLPGRYRAEMRKKQS